ncbi:MAG: phenylacetic acid degradation bifunctional protein PaaZ [Saprospiraceae bacterium]
MSNRTHDFILDAWTPHQGDGIPQYDAVDGSIVATAGNEALDYERILAYGRDIGGSALRKMTTPARGRMLKALAFYLEERKAKYYEISYRTGATRADSWIDIDGGIGTLFAYASLRRQFADQPFHVEGDTVRLSKQGTFSGHHILVPKLGVAVHINAFNFPIWGMLEKLSATLMGGMPAVIKASEMTSFVTEAMVRDIHESGILPKGSLQLISGSGRGILDHVMHQDVVTFTGSASTGRMLRANARIIAESVPFNMEADSLNACVLGPDATPDSPEFALFIKEVRRELTAKTGQKCTAIRRIMVPEGLVEEVQIALGKAFAKTTIGDPRDKSVRMGALVNRQQLSKLGESIEALQGSAEIVIGGPDRLQLIGADADKGAFFAPTILLDSNPSEGSIAHEIEAFGPVATIMPYSDLGEAIELTAKGKGSLVTTMVTNDPAVAREFTYGAAPYNGRIHILNREAKESTGHGAPMPGLKHGGPGRAGGGEELGGARSVVHYMNRCAVQGHPTMVTALTQQYQEGAAQFEDRVHPFAKYWEELQVGETYTTANHTVTTTDIINFANVSGDHFYAHVDETSLGDTLFEGRVAHGYYLLSKAAGLFVYAKKGPVLLNYGIDTCRFTKPVYPGTTIGVRLTVLDKTWQELREEDDIPKGIVRWRVELRDVELEAKDQSHLPEEEQESEIIGVATILTMVRRIEE